MSAKVSEFQLLSRASNIIMTCSCIIVCTIPSEMVVALRFYHIVKVGDIFRFDGSPATSAAVALVSCVVVEKLVIYRPTYRGSPGRKWGRLICSLLLIQ